MESRIDCVNIHKINCGYCTENRLCPDDCKGFVSVEKEVINIVEEPIKNKFKK
jgi:hypothetical protein